MPGERPLPKGVHVMKRRRFITTMVLVCAFGLSLLGVAGKAEAASKIAYPCIPGGFPGLLQVCLINPDGSGETVVTNFTTDRFGDGVPIVTWSPDGTQFAFCVPDLFVGGSCEVLVYNVDGTFSHSFLPQNYHYHQLAWSPEITPTVAAISPLGQLVIVFLLGAVTALYFSRQREQASGLIGS